MLNILFLLKYTFTTTFILFLLLLNEFKTYSIWIIVQSDFFFIIVTSMIPATNWIQYTGLQEILEITIICAKF